MKQLRFMPAPLTAPQRKAQQRVMREVGRRLRGKLGARTIASLARAVGTQASNLSAMVGTDDSDATRLPPAELLVDLARELGCDLDDLVPDGDLGPEAERFARARALWRVRAEKPTRRDPEGKPERSDLPATVPPQLAAYLELRGDDITPRERRFLQNVRFKLDPGDELGNDFYDAVLAGFRKGRQGPGPG